MMTNKDTQDPLEHEITLRLATGADLKLIYFSDRALRWVFSYDYVGEKADAAPDVVNTTGLVANYEEGFLDAQLMLSMHVVVPARLWRQFFAGVDISPGEMTYLEFTYQAPISSLDNHVGDAYRLVEIRKGTQDRVRLDGINPALAKSIEFPFPIPDRIPIEYGAVRVPFLTNAGLVAHFDLPTRTIR